MLFEWFIGTYIIYIQGCNRSEFVVELKKIETWTYGKCELYHWIDILDLCDEILEDATRREPGSWVGFYYTVVQPLKLEQQHAFRQNAYF